MNSKEQKYHTCDPNKVAYLMVRDCRRDKIDDTDVENIIFTMIGVDINQKITDLHDGTPIDPNRFIACYKEVMGIIRDIRNRKKQLAQTGGSDARKGQ